MQRSCPDYNTLCDVLSPLFTEAWKPQLNNLALSSMVCFSQDTSTCLK